MVLKKSEYVKKYVGNVDPRRTNSFVTKGVDMKKYTIKSSVYPGLFKLIRKRPYNDITGYIMNGKVRAAKNKLDRKKKSKTQKWEL